MSVTDGDYIAPTFYRNFAGTQALNAGIGPSITFTRSTSATFVNSQGYIQTVTSNIPRFDCDPVTLQCRGLLIEESRTNLALNSGQMQLWTVGPRITVSANATGSPDGTTSATKIIETTANGLHWLGSNSFNITAGSTYTYSVFVKAAERSFAYLSVAQALNGTSAGEIFVNYNLTSLASSQSNATGTPPAFVGSSITPAGNGWFRLSIAVTLSASGVNQIYFYVGSATSMSWATYAGDGTSGIYVWGGQLEAGTFATSYIPTGASQATRNADLALVTGSNFTSFYNQKEGTCVVAANRRLPSGASAPAPRIVDSGQIIIFLVKGVQMSINVNTGVYAQSLGPSYAEDGSTIKGAVTYSTNVDGTGYGNGAVNGILGIESNSGTAFATSQIAIGDSGASTRCFNGCISSIAYYPRRFSNFALQYITR